MPFDWHEYLGLAEDVHEAPVHSMDASERTAISRAYYAAFHLTAAALEDRNEWRRQHNADDHAELRRFLERYRGRARGNVGVNLGRLYIARCQADYNDELASLSELAQAMLLTARKIVQALPNI
jgi:uncharacterized protein (UPF0332 family)